MTLKNWKRSSHWAYFSAPTNDLPGSAHASRTAQQVTRPVKGGTRDNKQSDTGAVCLVLRVTPLVSFTRIHNFRWCVGSRNLLLLILFNWFTFTRFYEATNILIFFISPSLVSWKFLTVVFIQDVINSTRQVGHVIIYCVHIWRRIHACFSF